jgi:hypothetical protein
LLPKIKKNKTIKNTGFEKTVVLLTCIPELRIESATIRRQVWLMRMIARIRNMVWRPILIFSHQYGRGRQSNAAANDRLY